MNAHLRVTLLVCLFCSAAPPVLPAGTPAEGDTLITGFIILIGFPSGDQPASGVATLIPGTVIPLASGMEVPDRDIRRDVVQRSMSLSKAVDKLWNTFRLDPSRQLQETVSAETSAGRVLSIPVPEGIDLKVTATLLGFDDKVAKYRIVFRQGEKSLADSTVPVGRGGRAVVGGMNGEAAPYIFLFIEPEAAVQGVAAAERRRGGIGLKPPVVVTRVTPKYPEAARMDKVSGTVELELTLGSNGLIREVVVLGSPDPRLAEAAAAAVKQWKFEPARLPDGSPVGAIMTISFRFALK